MFFFTTDAFLAQLTPASVKFVNHIWIAGRFFFAGIIVLGTIGSLGWYPGTMSVFDLDPSQKNSGSLDDRDNENDPENGNDPATQDDEITPENLVSDWEKPDFALFVTGRQHGYIEPCGCITLARQKGGLMRRHRVEMVLQEKGWDLVAIDAGNQVDRFGQQPVIKLGKTFDGLCKVMKYDMVGLGPDDLKLPGIDIAQIMANVVGNNNPFTCANVEVIDSSLTNKFVVINRGGKRIGVTMVLGDEYLESLKDRDGLTVTSVREGLVQAVPQLQNAKCDFHVLVAFTELEKCRELAKTFPIFNLLVTAGGAGDPTFEPEMIEAPSHVTPMIQVGVKGMYVGLVGVYQKDGQTKIKYKRVALTHKFEDTDEMKKVFLSYQEELKSLWLSGALKDIVPRDHPKKYTFVGSDQCADCHSDEYEIWLDGVDGDGGPHVVSTDSLKQNPNDDRVWVQRHYDPECMSCHATGWNPQNYYPYKSGLVDITKQQHLFGNGCENCHGPGSAHVEMEREAAKRPVDEKLQTQLREELDITIAQAKESICMQCHDLDNSPDFLLEGGFAKYWAQVEHGDGDDE